MVALYFRAFPSIIFRRILIGTVVLVIMWQIAYQVVWGFFCQPIRKFWDPSTQGSCIDIAAEGLSNSVLNVILDVWIFILPLPMIFRMHISWQKKALLACVFSVGLGYVVL